MQKIIVLLGAAFIGLLLVYWLARDNASTSQQPAPVKLEAPEETAPASTQSEHTNKATLPAINEHRKVSIQGYNVSLDSRGSLIPTPAVRELFNAIAIKQGEAPADQWKHEVLNEYSDQLPSTAFDQLQLALNRFIEYNLALQMLPIEGASSLASAMEQVKSLRANYLGLTNAQGMYSDWQQLEQFADDYVLLMLTQPDPSQIQSELQEKIDALPSTVQPRAQKVLEQSEELLNTLPVARADPAGFRALAEQKAAGALIQPNFTFAEPDPKFIKRFDEYKTAKIELMEKHPDSSQYDTALKKLRKELFSATELLRVETLERAEQM